MNTEFLRSYDSYKVSIICMYRIALNFRRSKFSQIAIFEDFVEIISRIRCTSTLHAVCQKFSLKYFHKRLKIREIREIEDL